VETVPFKLLVIDAVGHAVLCVDGPSGEILTELPLPRGCSAVDLAVCTDYQAAYISLANSDGTGSLRLLDLRALTLDSSSPLIPYPAKFCPAPARETVYLADRCGSLYAFALGTSTLTSWSKPAGSGSCAGLACDGELLYGAWETDFGGVIATFDRQGNMLTEYAIGGIPTNLILDHQGRLFIPYTASAFSGEGVCFFSPKQKDALCAVVTLQCSRCCIIGRAYPIHVAVDPEGQVAYVACEDNATIGVIDIAGARLIGSISLGRSVSRIHLLPDSRFAIASSNMFADLCLVDLVNKRPVSFTATKREILCPLAIIK
jgi:DNA-binding beta-propeller fold protein YncE